MLSDGRLELVEEVLVRVLDLIDIGLLLLEESGDFRVLIPELRQNVLRLLDDSCKIRRILRGAAYI